MSDDPHSTFSALLEQARLGDHDARDQLFAIVYEELKPMARRQRRRRQALTLSTTELVHEAYIKLGGSERFGARDRSHFMAVAATAMRQILIDHARSRLTAKRGSGQPKISLDEIESAFGSGPDFTDARADAVLAINAALERLAARSTPAAGRRGMPVLRRILHRGNGRCAGYRHGNRETGLGNGSVVALPRAWRHALLKSHQ